MANNFVERLPNFGIIAAAGFRDPKKTPRFLATKEIQCPKCGRIEYANVDQKDVVMCSLCLMSGVFTAEKKEGELGPPLARKTKQIRFRVRVLRKCERCGEMFRGRSNRQRFCEKCQKWAERERKTAWQKEQRENGSVVDV